MFPTDRVVLKGLCFTLLERIDCTHICFETVTYSVPCVKKMWVNRRVLETPGAVMAGSVQCSYALVLNGTGRRLYSLLCFSFIKICCKKTSRSLLWSKLYIPFQLCWDGRISFQQHFKGICTHLLKIFKISSLSPHLDQVWRTHLTTKPTKIKPSNIYNVGVWRFVS